MTALEQLDAEITKAREKYDELHTELRQQNAHLLGMEKARAIVAEQAEQTRTSVRRLSFAEALEALPAEFTREQLEALPGFGPDRAQQFISKYAARLTVTETEDESKRPSAFRFESETG